jgi:hypothetical protein
MALKPASTAGTVKQCPNLIDVIDNVGITYVSVVSSILFAGLYVLFHTIPINLLGAEWTTLDRASNGELRTATWTRPRTGGYSIVSNALYGEGRLSCG